ncbi:formate dehydrogenase accessory sulfurtransferase FdhD [Haloglycomyces albus]|uniref:formate dehydrogenase accessory sulfurtransferase FdhD n=1 Tax=Haloglycomyces albus TaxID=526067 RepID=UPI00046D8458|nr:formate dehydrogenase accessory sulfurtransferase FdhD [Haloglycomyces albus]
MGRRVTRRRITAVRDDRPRSTLDSVIVEEPLEIRISQASYTTTMRTPGDDFDFTCGHLYTEGVIVRADDLVSVGYCRRNGADVYNIVDVRLADHITAPCARDHPVTSACGVCGSTSIADIMDRIPRQNVGTERISRRQLVDMHRRMRPAQKLFDRTGGNHAAALFDDAGEPAVVREDIGRHNAVDKVIGWAWREGRLPLRGDSLAVTSRASFDIVQKAAMAGIGLLSVVSAPSSLAVDLAAQAGMTLVAFNRGDRFNVYTHPERIDGLLDP